MEHYRVSQISINDALRNKSTLNVSIQVSYVYCIRKQINKNADSVISLSHTVEGSAWRRAACLECRAGGSSGSPTVEE